MRLGIICGSHRENSESARIGRFVDARITALIANSKTYLLDLSGNPLPMWDESIWAQGDIWKKTWQPIANELTSCDGYVVISPEWSGMVPSGLKNFFLMTSAAVIGHKPALIITVSSSRGGSYPVAELRMSSYKNTRLCYIPEHVIIRDCNNMLVGEQPQSEDDRYIRDRLDYALRVLGEYTVALTHVRESGVIDHKSYPNGM